MGFGISIGFQLVDSYELLSFCCPMSDLPSHRWISQKRCKL